MGFDLLLFISIKENMVSLIQNGKGNVADSFFHPELMVNTSAPDTVLGSSLIGIPIGVLMAARRNMLIDRSVNILAMMFAAIPTFVVALGMIYFFAVKLEWLPAYGAKTWKHYILPMETLKKYYTVLENRTGLWLEQDEIVYLSDKSGVSQVWKMNIREKKPVQLTFLHERVLRLEVAAFLKEHLL